MTNEDKGKQFEILEDCNCQSEAYELLFDISSWPKKILKKGDVVTLVLCFESYLGIFCRVMKDNIYYDIYPKYLKEI
jgi:hypothetical protein